MGKIYIYDTLDKNKTVIEENGRLCDILKDFDFENAVLLKNGHRIEKTYEVTESDIIFVRKTPAGVTRYRHWCNRRSCCNRGCYWLIDIRKESDAKSTGATGRSTAKSKRASRSDTAATVCTGREK